ncbi:RNase H domain-containing protein [Trichonephila clavipes]|nr:RNase H domain-containing protein [Trichonephila clavipes]
MFVFSVVLSVINLVLWTFMEFYGTLAVQDCLDSEGIQRLVWPARSPDVNPIENVWDALGRQVTGRNYPPTNKNTLIRALTEEWDNLPQQLLDNVVQSMDSIRILTDNRSFLQYLKNWPKNMDSSGLDILSKWARLGQRKQVYLRGYPCGYAPTSNKGIPTCSM